MVLGGYGGLSGKNRLQLNPVKMECLGEGNLHPGFYHLWSWMVLHYPRQIWRLIWQSSYTHESCLKSKWQLWLGGFCSTLCYAPVLCPFLDRKLSAQSLMPWSSPIWNITICIWVPLKTIQKASPDTKCMGNFGCPNTVTCNTSAERAAGQFKVLWSLKPYMAWEQVTYRTSLSYYISPSHPDRQGRYQPKNFDWQGPGRLFFTVTPTLWNTPPPRREKGPCFLSLV